MQDRDMKRRGFLRAGTSAVAAPVAAIASKAYAAGGDTIKVALVGCGGRGTGAVAQALSTPGPVKLWAMADAFEDMVQSSYKALTRGQDDRYAYSHYDCQVSLHGSRSPLDSVPVFRLADREADVPISPTHRPGPYCRRCPPMLAFDSFSPPAPRRSQGRGLF